MKIGLTMGKFLPFHQGHEFLLQTACACVDYLIVIIGTTPDDPYTFDQRREWVRKSLDGYSKVLEIFEEKEESNRSLKRDKDGTIISKKFWDKWLTGFRETISERKFWKERGLKLTHVFTSDKYGERVAKELGAEWYPVDPDRVVVPVSGTKVRNDLWGNWGFLPPYVRRDLVKTVAIVGPESTGKSTLVKELEVELGYPKHLLTTVPEYGRTVCEPRDNTLTHEDFLVILNGQAAMIQNAKSRSLSPVVVTDTEAIVTALYYDLWFPRKGPSISHLAIWNKALELSKADLYIVMAPTVKWVDDGTRVMSEDIERWKFYYELVKVLRDVGKNFITVENSQYHLRKAEVVKAIKGFVK